MKFNEATKEVKEFEGGDWFDFGLHKVQVALITTGKTDNGKEYVEVEVVDPENGERHDTARVWFTTDKAANYSFNVLRAIYVHNAPEDKKDAARKTIDEVKDTVELVDVLNKKLIGGECWFTKYLSPDRTYTDKNTGETKPSIDKNIYGYEPKLRPELIPAKSNADLMADAVKKTMPGAEEVPFESEGDAKPSSTVPKGW